MSRAVPAPTRTVRTIGAAIAALSIAAIGVLAVGRPASADRSLPTFGAPPLRPGDPQLTDQLVRGQPAVLVFWASWCEPCQREIPAIAAGPLLHSNRVRIIGVDTNDRRAGGGPAGAGPAHPADRHPAGRT